MYHLIRRIHLVAGLVLLIWIVMYFATGLPLIHEKWLPQTNPKTTTANATMDGNSKPENPDFWRTVEDRFEIRGRRGMPQERKPGEWRMQWYRPGTQVEANYVVSSNSLTIKKSEHGARHIVVGLHRLHGYGGGFLYDIYALMLDLSSIAVMLFSLSGIYLWWGSTRQKLPGVVALGLSVAFTLGMIVHLMTHP